CAAPDLGDPRTAELRTEMPLGQPVALAEQAMTQRTFLIGRLVEAALLQLRYHDVDEILVALGRHRPRQVEAVDLALLDPGGELIGDLTAVADGARVAATDLHLFEQLALGPAALLGQLGDRLDGIRRAVADRFVEIVFRE